MCHVFSAKRKFEYILQERCNPKKKAEILAPQVYPNHPMSVVHGCDMVTLPRVSGAGENFSRHCIRCSQFFPRPSGDSFSEFRWYTA